MRIAISCQLRRRQFNTTRLPSVMHCQPVLRCCKLTMDIIEPTSKLCQPAAVSFMALHQQKMRFAKRYVS